MQQRLNVLTLGVDDVGRARSFYEALGWKIGFTDGDIVMFQAGPMIISLWDRAKLAADSGVPAGTGWGGFTMGYAVGDAAEVDEVCEARRRGRRDRHRGPAEEGLRLLRRLRRPRRPHLGGRLDRGAARHPDGTVELPS